MTCKLTRSLSGLAWLLPALLLFVAADERLLAQEAQKAETKRAAKQRAEPRGRLPAYYTDVVDGEQREKIYAIQQKYAAEVKAIEDQLAALNKKIDDEMASVLRPEQLKKVEDLRKEAMEKRKQQRAAGKQEGTPATPSTPATPAKP